MSIAQSAGYSQAFIRDKIPLTERERERQRQREYKLYSIESVALSSN